MSKVKVCEKFYCDYAPCVEERIAQLDAEGFDTGKLRKSLRISAGVRRRGTVISGRVIAPRGARHATPLEYGHRIAVGSSGRTEKGGVLKRRGRQRSLKLGQFSATSAGHVAPHPFLHQTFSATVRTIERDFTASFIAQVNQAAVLNG